MTKKRLGTTVEREREREFIFLPVHVSQKKKKRLHIQYNSTVTHNTIICAQWQELSTKKPLGYRVKMLPGTNAVNSEIKKMKMEKKIQVSGNTIRYK